MQHYVGQTVEVLVEDKHKGRWRGRNPQNKLVFFNDTADQKGKLVQVLVSHAGPWSMSGTMVDGSQPSAAAKQGSVSDGAIPLTVI